MKQIILGQKNATYCLIQAVDEHDASFLEEEYRLIREYTGRDDILLAAFQVDDWNYDLSPWEAPPVFGEEAFGDGAKDTLYYVRDTLLPQIGDEYMPQANEVKYIIGGYSLAGLFALWASYESDIFCACAAASPSVWFPGWMEYGSSHEPKAEKIYLSLGNKEEKAKNPVMATVGDCIRKQYALLQERGIPSVLEWNPGNHFKEPEIRTAKAFAWCISGR